MEKETKWLCDCGKSYVQPQGDQKFPVREKCECGKNLYKLMDPDGVVTEFVDAPEWFVKEFDEQDKKMGTINRNCDMWAGRYFSALEQVTALRVKYQEEHKRMKNVVEHGARRTKDLSGLGLSKRRDMKWNFNRMLKKWLGRKSQEVKNDKR